METYEQQNVQRARQDRFRIESLHTTVIHLGQAPLDAVLGYRQAILNAQTRAVEDLSIIDAELAYRTPIAECGD